ncbi:hypothetical protein AKJ09_09708 [Labilithrix luteola]|uniref:Uncharacterized protein n=1 Tax=Labilithrix luteola TaxID=1391654 RepID=A0A0K1QC85_9BACT|nr:hypothetical protein AKJ09_09708 [Labilithrix luteola]
MSLHAASSAKQSARPRVSGTQRPNRISNFTPEFHPSARSTNR